MKYLYFFVLITAYCILHISLVQAEIMYVNDLRTITFRTGPGIGHKVMEEIPSGQMVTVLKQDSGWANVRLPDGKEGWVLSRFLISEKPNELLIAELEEKHKTLTTHCNALTEENTKLKAENNTLKSKSDDLETRLNDLDISYKELETGCAEYKKDKAKYDTSLMQLADQKKRADMCEEKYKSVQKDQLITGGLVGGGILLLGLIIGYIMSGSRRKSYFR